MRNVKNFAKCFIMHLLICDCSVTQKILNKYQI